VRGLCAQESDSCWTQRWAYDGQPWRRSAIQAILCGGPVGRARGVSASHSRRREKRKGCRPVPGDGWAERWQTRAAKARTVLCNELHLFGCWTFSESMPKKYIMQCPLSAGRSLSSTPPHPPSPACRARHKRRGVRTQGTRRVRGGHAPSTRRCGVLSPLPLPHHRVDAGNHRRGLLLELRRCRGARRL